MNGARGDLDLGGLFDGLAEGRAVRKAGIAGDALGQKDGAVDGQVLEELLGALVRVEHAQLQVQDGLAGDGEVEVAGLDDAGVDRADGNLKDAFAQGRAGRRAARLRTAEGLCRSESPCAAGARPASCRAARRGADWDGPPASMPNQSWISRSCQFTAGIPAATEGNAGSPAVMVVRTSR